MVYSLGSNRTVSRDCRIFDNPAYRVPPAGKPLKIVISSNKKYLANLLNWLVFFLRICKDVSLLYLVCYDFATDEVMRKYGLKCSKIFRDSYRIWDYRSQVTLSLLSDGYDVIVSDSDALWIDNPMTFINNFSGYDFVGSRGTFPHVTTSLYGASYCMGFAYIKSNDKTIQMYTEITDQMKKQQTKPDDQETINLWLMNQKMKYDSNPDMIGTEPRFAKIKMKRPSNKELKVVSAPQRLIRRVCSNVTKEELMNTAVAHCLVYSGGRSKNGHSKQEVSIQMGLWAIKTDWHTIPFAGHDIKSFIRTISD